MSRPSLLAAVGLMHNMVAAFHKGGQLRKKRLEWAFGEANSRQERTEILNTVVTDEVEVGSHRARDNLVNGLATVADQLAKEKFLRPSVF
jgi:hypothetical protein